MKRPSRHRRDEKKADSGRDDADTSHWQGGRVEGRRLIAEFWGTFLLTLVATGAGALHKIDLAEVSAAAAMVAPGAMVMTAIYFLGGVSGAHINPAVTLAFALRGNFPWIRVPGYIVVQLAGAIAAAAFLLTILGPSGSLGTTSTTHHLSLLQALAVEALLTTVLVNTILGTASETGFLGPNAAIPVGAYIALAGLWAGSLTGASMNPARSIGPDVVWTHFSETWLYVAGPLIGALAGVALEWALKGPPSEAGDEAAQGKDHAGNPG